MTLQESLEQDPRERSRRYGLRDGACQAVTQGSGEQYLSAFALLLGANPLHLSVLSALPQLIGTGAQLASVKLIRCFRDRKALIRAGTTGQALSWLPIVVLPLLFPDAVPQTVQALLGLVGGVLIAGLGMWLLMVRLAGRADHVHLGRAVIEDRRLRSGGRSLGGAPR